MWFNTLFNASHNLSNELSGPADCVSSPIEFSGPKGTICHKSAIESGPDECGKYVSQSVGNVSVSVSSPVKSMSNIMVDVVEYLYLVLMGLYLCSNTVGGLIQ